MQLYSMTTKSMIRNALFLLPFFTVGRAQKGAVRDTSLGATAARKRMLAGQSKTSPPTKPPTSPPGPTTPGPSPLPPGPGPSGGGPKVAMAWISDQFANFDVAWNMSGVNQFKSCHNWLKNSGINVVSLAFLKPTEILDPSICASGICTDKGVRIGMPGAIEYFKGEGMNLVFLSIGGVSYTSFWEEVLVNNATAGDFATKVAAIAQFYQVGIEIDYEESASPNLAGLEHFVKTYRSIIPYNDTYWTPASFLTLDFGQGAQFMGPTANWVAKNAFNTDPAKRLLNWANAMVAGSSESRVTDLINRWNQHVNGYSTLQTHPIAPAYLVGSLWSSGRSVQDSCVNPNSPTLLDVRLVDYIKNVKPCVAPKVGCKAYLPAPTTQYTDGLLGYAFWMCGNIGPRQVNTCPIDTTIEIYGTSYPGNGDCTPGFRAANATYNIPRTVNWDSRKY
ncbi:hypothetical protein ACHAW5_004884 [Stephanodiscus triporus]|uniref:GH18 domain-containing protein n=1 Tax=Stephanodiscus triporus TaxID=2934178 RepID=A0ABD3P5U4_9STRA